MIAFNSDCRPGKFNLDLLDKSALKNICKCKDSDNYLNKALKANLRLDEDFIIVNKDVMDYI